MNPFQLPRLPPLLLTSVPHRPADRPAPSIAMFSMLTVSFVLESKMAQSSSQERFILCSLGVG